MDKIVFMKWMSPAGPLVLGSYEDAICLCDWDLPERRRRVDGRLCRLLEAEMEWGGGALLERLRVCLEEYFAGERRAFDLPLVAAGTPFQHRVWELLGAIPYGATTTYGALAAALGRPSAVRALANAVGANPLSILIPCHRVVGADGSLTGYAGGLRAKRLLLELEKPKLC